MTENKKADIGETILFERKDNTFEGKVLTIRDNSVLVQISEQAAKYLKYETLQTVVRHGKYTLNNNPIATLN